MQDAEEASAQTSEQPAVTAAEPGQVGASIDLSNRPDPGWLDEVEGELNDVDTVLKCLARDSVTRCGTCDELASRNELDGRSVLLRCASTKQSD